MEDRLINKFMNIVKDKFGKKKTTYHNNYEYAFSTEEIASISEQNKQKIQELKQDIFEKKKNNKEKVNADEVLLKVETNILSENAEDDLVIGPVEELVEPPEEIKDEVLGEKCEEVVAEEKPESIQNNSFINLSSEHQRIVMDKWNEIKLNKIDKDIIDGKDLLNHNYTITYADDAARFIHYIRKEYEVVICYLIGFNNEKQGIMNKTIFSEKLDDEWKYLSNYIKMLEKIRNFKK